MVHPLYVSCISIVVIFNVITDLLKCCLHVRFLMAPLRVWIRPEPRPDLYLLGLPLKYYDSTTEFWLLFAMYLKRIQLVRVRSFWDPKSWQKHKNTLKTVYLTKNSTNMQNVWRKSYRNIAKITSTLFHVEIICDVHNSVWDLLCNRHF